MQCVISEGGWGFIPIFLSPFTPIVASLRTELCSAGTEPLRVPKHNTVTTNILLTYLGGLQLLCGHHRSYIRLSEYLWGPSLWRNSKQRASGRDLHSWIHHWFLSFQRNKCESQRATAVGIIWPLLMNVTKLKKNNNNQTFTSQHKAVSLVDHKLGRGFIF